MKRRKFSREFKVEAVKLVRERGVSVAQAGRDLDVHENVLRKGVKEFGSDPVEAFPGHGQMKPEQHEIERLKREVNKLKAERDTLKKPQPSSRGKRYEVRLHRDDLPPKEWTGLSRSALHFGGADVAQSRMQAARIVEPFDVAEQIMPSLGTCGLA